MTDRSLSHQVEQMLIGGFHGTVVPDYLLDWLREGHLAGLILFSRNVESPEQLASLTVGDTS